MPTRLTKIVLFSAVVAGGAALWSAGFTSGYGSDEAVVQERVVIPPVTPSFPAPVVPATTDILAPQRAIAQGERITPEMFTTVAIADGQLSPDLFTATPASYAQIAGQFALRELPADIPTRSTDIGSESDLRALSLGPSLLRPGMYGIAISVSPETAVAGLITRGDHVDVLMTYRNAAGSGGSRVLLKNVRVVATDLMTEETGDRPDAPPKTLTLEVTQEAAMVIALAREVGKLSVVLTSDRDPNALSQVIAYDPLREDDLLGLPFVAPVVPDTFLTQQTEPVEPPAPTRVEVRVMRAGVRTVSEVPVLPMAPVVADLEERSEAPGDDTIADASR